MAAKETKTRSALTELREQIPQRALTGGEARQVLERQATRLLRLTETLGPPVPIHVLASELPRVKVKQVADLPVSGSAQWNGQAWVLLINASEPGVRQHFSLAHELAHVVWHSTADRALPDTARTAAAERIEWACEYFAACLLMPRLWMKRAYFNAGIQDVPSLSRLFGVSWVAMQVRLEQLGFVPREAEATEEAA
jgi:Zn-dependent peptidase ImmA (M78 family)